MTHARRALNESLLSPAELRDLFSYDPDTGLIHRRCKRGLSLAGNVQASGYMRIRIRGRFYASHRVAWCLAYGHWPLNYVDHINGVRDDNRLVNLRDATHAQNLHNSKKFASVGAQLKGITRLPSGNWRAQISVGGKSRHIGTYPTEAAAHSAYMTAAAVMFGEFARAA